ncbi:MAG: DNA adenine methylase [Promethearchaeota archaeon]
MVEKEKILFRKITGNFSDLDRKDVVSFSNKINYDSLPHPFLKWAGGKRQLLSQMDLYFPQKFIKYIEPFVGGGAVFFHLFKKNLLKNKKAILIDINSEIINVYNVIQKNVYNLIKLLKNHKNEEEYYYRIRTKDRDTIKYSKMASVEKASRMIYLNRCCYNGLYRVNSKGQFNVPFGKYKNPNFCNEENLIAVKKALKDIIISHSSFEDCLNYAKKDDFIYFDPPYSPLSETSSFTSYTKEDFKEDSQKKLFEVFQKLDERGCKLMLSNSANNFIRNLYSDYEIITLKARRVINCNAEKRGNIDSLLILNDY